MIFAGIVAGLPGAIGQSAEAARQGDLNILGLLAIGIIAVGVCVRGIYGACSATYYRELCTPAASNKVYAAQQSHLPLKINMVGKIPLIFASSCSYFLLHWSMVWTG